YPITNEFSEVSELNAQTYRVQYFQRALFEYHPENQPPNDVLLAQLGTFQFRQRYPDGDPSPPFQPTPIPQELANCSGVPAGDHMIVTPDCSALPPGHVANARASGFRPGETVPLRLTTPAGDPANS